MRRGRLVNLSLGLLAVIGALGLLVWWQVEERAAEDARAARQAARRQAREEREAQRQERLLEESRELMPAALRGLALGMTKDDVAELRARMVPKVGATTDRDKDFYEEELSNGAEVVYGFDRETDSLAQVQVLSVLPSADAFLAHFRAMVEAYGRPTGAWDCPDINNGAPTRRFTWRKARTTLADIFLIYGNRISVTLYIAPTETIAQSLRRGRCQPVTSQEQLLEFPTTSLEAINAGQEAPNGPR